MTFSYATYRRMTSSRLPARSPAIREAAVAAFPFARSGIGLHAFVQCVESRLPLLCGKPGECLRIPKAKKRSNVREQHCWFDRLGEIRVCSAVERLHAAFAGSKRSRDLKYGDIRSLRIGLDAAAHFIAVQLRQTDVKQHRVGTQALGGF